MVLRDKLVELGQVGPPRLSGKVEPETVSNYRDRNSQSIACDPLYKTLVSKISSCGGVSM